MERERRRGRKNERKDKERGARLFYDLNFRVEDSNYLK